MLIDLSTSIVIAFSVGIAAFTAALNVYISKDLTNKEKHYCIIVFVAIIAFFIIGILHYWDAFNRFLDGVVALLLQVFRDTESKVISFNAVFRNFANDFGFKLLLSCGLFPWIPFYYRIIRTTRKYHGLTGAGIIFIFIFLPALTIYLEVKFSMWLFSLLRSLGAVTYIILASVLNFCVNSLFATLMIKR